MAPLSMKNFGTRDISRGNGQLYFHFQLCILWLQSYQIGYEFQKNIQGFELFEESKTFCSNGNLLLLPKIQRLYCMPSEE